MSTLLFTNRLIHEKSPYLLQHAHNPVDWYPWGEEAFDLAKKLDKPIFLSIGYATCHWCHVMQKESFENSQIADLMNAHFVNVKVDREELPQLDSFYMELAQALMGSAGGWPLNLILTPDLKPFFAVTYLPPFNGKGLVGMHQFIQHIGQLWESDERAGLLDQAHQMIEILKKVESPQEEQVPTKQTFLLAVHKIRQLMDPLEGGFKGEPKFPMGYQSQCLMQCAHDEEESLILLTLDKMLAGGIYDQLGGGFSRYATDEYWLLPHFEKMLYDNAILSRTYLDAWKCFRKENYRIACEEILDYILNEMTRPGGGFYTAQDADSQGQEGMFYTWTPAEIREVLGPEEADLFCTYYGVTANGNIGGRSVLHVMCPLEELSSEKKAMLFGAKIQLKQARMKRARPFTDDKILVSWNGLMIDAMIRAGTTFKKPEYCKAAIQAAEFIKADLWKEGRLFHRWRDGQARFKGGLDDYAFLLKGLLSLFEEDWGSEWLQMAIQLEKSVRKGFKAEGGAFYSSQEDPFLILRKREYYDSAEPSGNAVHCENLLRLYQLTGDGLYLTQAEEILKCAAHLIDTYPLGACYHLMNLQRYWDTMPRVTEDLARSQIQVLSDVSYKARTIVVALDEKESLKEEIHRALNTRFRPHTVVIWKRERDSLLCSLIPSLIDKNPINGQTTVYVCSGESCGLPVTGLAGILQALEPKE